MRSCEQSPSLLQPHLLSLLYKQFAARDDLVFHCSTVQEVGAPVRERVVGVVQGASLHVSDLQVDLNLGGELLFNESFE